MSGKYLFTARRANGFGTSITLYGDDWVEMDAGSGRVVALSIQDVRKIVREYNKAKKEKTP